MDFQSLLTWLNTNSGALQALASCIGVPGVLVSLFFLWRQSRDQTLATRATIYQNITATMLEIDRYFIEHPELKKYFFDNTPITKKHREYERVKSIAEMFLDFMDFTLEHKPGMEDYPWSQWENYFKSVYDTSPALRELWEEVKGLNWYEKEVGEVFARGE